MKHMKKRMAKAMKTHMMYKDGKAVKVSTREQHLRLMKKGYGHKPGKK